MSLYALRQADYWKSQPRKFCDFCKCWIADNKPSRDFHERGKRHQENVAKKISEVRKKGMEQARNEKDVDGWMVQMEREALKKLREDLTTDPSLAAQYGVTIKSRSVETKEEEDSTGGSSDWQEELSPEGYVYYWNTKTKESRWNVPEDSQQRLRNTEKGDDDVQRKSKGDETVAEGNKEIERKSDSGGQQRTDGSTVWQKLHSTDGQPYYWNTQTGEVSWELPSSVATVDIKVKDDEEDEVTAAAASANDDNEKSSSPKESGTETKEACPSPKSPATEEEEEEDEEKVDPVWKRQKSSVYGEWQELKDESEESPLDLQLPVTHDATEVRTIVLSAEPKIKFKEKTMESLGIRSNASKPVEFKKRKLNSGAVKGNIRRTHDDSRDT